ncbi:hypothetical protein YC2023_011579 [Brassica napus]
MAAQFTRKRALAILLLLIPKGYMIRSNCNSSLLDKSIKREIIVNLSIAYIRDEIPNFNRPSVLKESRKKKKLFRHRLLSTVSHGSLGEKTPTTEEEDRDTNLAATSENINPMDSVEEEEE